MNNEFSKFIRTPSPTQNIAHNDFSQFKRQENKPEEEGGFFNKTIERPVEIAAQSAAAGLRSLPRTGYDFFKTAVKRLGGSTFLLEAAEENAPEWLKNITKEAFPTYEEVSEETHRQNPKLARPEGSIEKGIEKFGRFVGESPAFGGINGPRNLMSLVGLSAGMQLGEDQNLGPVGQFMTGAAGALLPGGIEGLAKGAVNAVKSPTKTLAKGVSKLAKTSDIKKQLINDAREAGVQLDLGSITDSGAVKFVQNQIAQSPLVGDALEVFKKDLSQQVINEYKSIVDSVGESSFQNNFQAGESVQNAIKANQQSSLESARKLYENARKAGKDAVVPTKDIRHVAAKISDQLFPGAIKSPEQLTVLDNLSKIEENLWNENVSVDSLINTKIALNDIIDYEVQGGSKQLLKKVVKTIDDTINKYGAQNPRFGKEWKAANKEFANHAKTFRNTNISNVLKTQDPATIFNKMNTTAGIRDVKKALSSTAEGKSLFNDLSRYKIDDLIGKTLEKNIKDQIGFGKIGMSLKSQKLKRYSKN